MPSLLTSSKGRQQSSMPSWNHRHAPFHMRRGSIASAFSTMLRLVNPQNAGSSCVLNCSMSLKKPAIVPSASASWNSTRPSGDANAVHGGVGICVPGMAAAEVDG
eukprot:366485-Chlamydomonas_euryale.AAC.28